jgi:predicted acyl esterase
VTEGGLRARYRNGGHADWLTTGKITEFTVELMQTAHTFQPGHRIRLEISSSNFPRFSRNLNSRVLPEMGTAEDMLVAEQRIFHSAAHPSCLIMRVTQ